MVNENINQVNFSSKTKEELSKINSVSGNKSLGAKKRWFREKNPDISALMEFYKNGNQLEVMEKYISDNEQFMDLFRQAESTEQKRKILRDYQAFQLKIYELMFGTKSNIDLKADVNVKQFQISLNLNRMAERYAESKIIDLYYEKWKSEFGEKQAQEMKNCVIYKFDIDKIKLKEYIEELKKIFVDAGNKHYKDAPELESISENRFKLIKKIVEGENEE